MGLEGKKPRLSKRDILSLPKGSEPDKQLERDQIITERVSIGLIGFFSNGDYHSPEDTLKFIRDQATTLGVPKIDLKSVASFLNGVLNAEDFDSHLHQNIEDRSMLIHTGEITTRHALTTLKAVVGEFKTVNITRKSVKK